MDARSKRFAMPMFPSRLSNEYGHFEGIVTPVDCWQRLRAILHQIRTMMSQRLSSARMARSWLLSGWTAADALAERRHYYQTTDYTTAAGCPHDVLKHIPRHG
jgi:putative hemolysin